MNRSMHVLAASIFLASWSLSVAAQESTEAPPADVVRDASSIAAPVAAAETAPSPSAAPVAAAGTAPSPSAAPVAPVMTAKAPPAKTADDYANVGDRYREAGQVRAARNAYLDALKLDRNHAAAREGLASLRKTHPIDSGLGPSVDSVGAARHYAEELRETDPGSYAALDRDVRELEAADTLGTIVTWMGLLGGGAMIAVAGVQMLTPCDYDDAMSIADIKATDDACQNEMVTSAGLMLGGLVLAVVGPLAGSAITPGKADVRRAVERSRARRRNAVRLGMSVAPRRDGALATLSLRVGG